MGIKNFKIYDFKLLEAIYAGLKATFEMKD